MTSKSISKLITITVILVVALLSAIISTYIYKLELTTSSTMIEWSNFGTFLAGISSTFTLIITIVTAALLLSQITNQKEANNFERLIKHRSMFFENIESYIESENQHIVTDKNRVYNNFFPNNTTLHINTITSTKDNEAFSNVVRIINSIDKSRDNNKINSLLALKEMIEINEFLCLKHTENISGDIIYNGRNYGINIFDINNVFKKSINYISSIGGFLRSSEDIPKFHTGYNKLEIKSIIKDIVAMAEKDSDNIYHIHVSDHKDGYVTKLYIALIMTNDDRLIELEKYCHQYLVGLRKGKSNELNNRSLSSIYMNLIRNKSIYAGHSCIVSETGELLEILENCKDSFQSYIDKQLGSIFDNVN